MTLRSLVVVVLVTVGGAGCASAPRAVAEPPATRDALHAALFGVAVDIVLRDGTRYDAARAVIVGQDSVRFVADGAALRRVSGVALAEVVEISVPARNESDIGILPGLLAGALFVSAANVVAPDAAIANARIGVAVVVLGGLVGWRAAARRPAPPPRIVYPLAPTP